MALTTCALELYLLKPNMSRDREQNTITPTRVSRVDRGKKLTKDLTKSMTFLKFLRPTLLEPSMRIPRSTRDLHTNSRENDELVVLKLHTPWTKVVKLLTLNSPSRGRKILTKIPCADQETCNSNNESGFNDLYNFTEMCFKNSCYVTKANICIKSYVQQFDQVFTTNKDQQIWCIP